MSFSKLEIEEKRRDENCVDCTQHEATFWVFYRPFGCRGLFKEEATTRRILRTWGPHSSSILRSSGGQSTRPGILSAHVRCRGIACRAGPRNADGPGSGRLGPGSTRVLGQPGPSAQSWCQPAQCRAHSPRGLLNHGSEFPP